jgi:hypothetical protein
MDIPERQVFRCQNRDCGREISVLQTSIETQANPRCSCGGEMKKPYVTPACRTLKSDLGIGATKSNKSHASRTAR